MTMIWESYAEGSQVGSAAGWVTALNIASGTGEAKVEIACPRGDYMDVQITRDGTVLDMGNWTKFYLDGYKMWLSTRVSFATSLKIEIDPAHASYTAYWKILYNS